LEGTYSTSRKNAIKNRLLAKRRALAYDFYCDDRGRSRDHFKNPPLFDKFVAKDHIVSSLADYLHNDPTFGSPADETSADSIQAAMN
jgi:hypothetical protein